MIKRLWKKIVYFFDPLQYHLDEMDDLISRVDSLVKINRQICAINKAHSIFPLKPLSGDRLMKLKRRSL